MVTKDQILKMGDLESGVRIGDLLDSKGFLSRKPKEHDSDRERLAMERLKNCGAENPLRALQEIVNIGVEFCHADSSGISLEEANEKGEQIFRWITVAGSFERYLNGTTPRFYSPCGTCLDRGVPQLYEIYNPYYNFLGVTAEPILDGMLIPWRTTDQQGTVWLISHMSPEAFDKSDYEFISTLINFATKELRNSAQDAAPNP